MCTEEILVILSNALFVVLAFVFIVNGVNEFMDRRRRMEAFKFVNKMLKDAPTASPKAKNEAAAKKATKKTTK